MAEKKQKAIDRTTEEKIKEAARKLFTQKGFAAVKTRDIASEAGINLALLNYYFRSKEKLFEIVMHENMKAFKKGIADLFSNESLDPFIKIEKIAAYYTDTFLNNPGLPLFIINEINSNIYDFFEDTGGIDIEKGRKVFMEQFQKLAKEERIEPVHPMHIMANLMGLILIPFLVKPLITKRFNVENEKFKELLEERKKLIPVWLMAMLGKK